MEFLINNSYKTKKNLEKKKRSYTKNTIEKTEENTNKKITKENIMLLKENIKFSADIRFKTEQEAISEATKYGIMFNCTVRKTTLTLTINVNPSMKDGLRAWLIAKYPNKTTLLHLEI